jgi:protein-disulfide isomerase
MTRAFVVAAALILAASSARADQPGFDPKAVYKIPRGTGAPLEGPADAPLTIVVWSDYACGFCNRVQGTLAKLDLLYPGQIRWVHRTLPLEEDYTLAAEVALAAAAQGRFRPMHERLFALRGRVTRAEAELVARELGLDMVQFRADLDARTYKPIVTADTADAEKLGVTATPTFFINGRPIHGNQSLRVFVDTADEELARAAQARSSKPADLYETLVGGGRAVADTPHAEHEDVQLDPRGAYRVGLGLPGHAIGPDDALVTIVTWSDFECHYCARNAPVLAKVRAKYGEQVRIVYRHLPMVMHRNAMLAAEAAAAAAAQGKFWPYHDRLWASFGKLTRPDLEAHAEAVGLDLAKFRAALDEHRHRNAILAEAATAEAFGVEGTPTMFINGQPVVGSREQADFERIVDAHLESAKSVIAKGLAQREIYPMVMSMAQGTDRADPSSVPVSAVVHIEMRSADRERAIEAACRRRDGARAKSLVGAAGFDSDARERAARVCAGEGIDL